MGSWARSKQLAASSWAVLKQDKELMVLPLISGLASLAVAATFLVPIFLTSRTTDALGNETWSTTLGGPGQDSAVSVAQTPDGGYVLAGATASSGGGTDRAWVVKTDPFGNPGPPLP